MLIRFVVSNFKSFKDETEFNLLTGKIRRFKDHLTKSRGIEILPTSVIFGSNASGKSNLVKALAYAKDLIVSGTEGDDDFEIDKFKLDKTYLNKPSTFEIDFKTSKKIYSYGISINYEEVVEEWLYILKSNKEEELLFERKGRKFKFGAKFIKNKKDISFLENEVRGLRTNQPFLAETKNRNISFFNDAREWFEDTLQIVFPQSNPRVLEYETKTNLSLKSHINELLNFADINTTIETKEIDFNSLLEAEPKLRKEISKKLKKNKDLLATVTNAKGIKYTIYNDDNNKIKVVKLIALHKSSSGKGNVEFELIKESDGTNRLINLAPAISNALNKNRVIVIDELDRSMHTKLTKNILKLFLSKWKEKKSKGQLIITTHESQLIDLSLLRPDEIWFTQKMNGGETKIYPMSEFNSIRYDIDAQKGYLKGRFGAIPNIGEIKNLELNGN